MGDVRAKRSATRTVPTIEGIGAANFRGRRWRGSLCAMADPTAADFRRALECERKESNKSHTTARIVTKLLECALVCVQCVCVWNSTHTGVLNFKSVCFVFFFFFLGGGKVRFLMFLRFFEQKKKRIWG